MSRKFHVHLICNELRNSECVNSNILEEIKVEDCEIYESLI